MNTYLFEDSETGEEFFVEATTEEEAKGVAENYFEEPQLLMQVSEEFAERMGLDTY